MQGYASDPASVPNARARFVSAAMRAEHAIRTEHSCRIFETDSMARRVGTQPLLTPSLRPRRRSAPSASASSSAPLSSRCWSHQIERRCARKGRFSVVSSDDDGDFLQRHRIRPQADIPTRLSPASIALNSRLVKHMVLRGYETAAAAEGYWCAAASSNTCPYLWRSTAAQSSQHVACSRRSWVGVNPQRRPSAISRRSATSFASRSRTSGIAYSQRCPLSRGASCLRFVKNRCELVHVCT